MNVPEIAANITRLAALVAVETDPVALRIEAEMILEAGAELWRLALAPASSSGTPPNDPAH